MVYHKANDCPTVLLIYSVVHQVLIHYLPTFSGNV